MSKTLVIFGASNFGDEVVQVIRDINDELPSWEILGFLDDDQSKWDTARDGIPVLGGREWLQNKPVDLQLFVAIGNPPARKRVVGAISSSYRPRFATAVHPTVVSSSSNTFGAGTLIMAGTVLTTNIHIGNHVIVNPLCTIGHNATIADFSTINPRAAIAGDIQIEEGVYVGIGATVKERLTLGRGAIIGAGAVVIRDVAPMATVVGVPAKAIKMRPDDLSVGE